MATHRFIKQISRSAGIRRAACWLGALYIRLVWYTGRWTIEGDASANRLTAEGRPYIICFWHGRMLVMPMTWRRDKPFHMLISNHPDGRLISGVVAHFGIDTTVGSTTRGGSAAFRSLVRILKERGHVGITPDGPSGPLMRASMGPVALARLAGAPVVPISFGAGPRRVMGTWDRMIVPWPFCRGTILWGEPIEIPEKADEAALEAARVELEDSLNRLTAEADRRAGQVPIEPAPAESASTAAEAAP